MMRYSGRLVAAGALFFIVGGHWGALQAVAWTKMLWEYSQRDGSFFAGAKMTFDGGHPCGMCDSIQEAKGKEESSPAVLAAVKKIEIFAVETADPLPRWVCGEFDFPVAADEFAVARGEAPPDPVPIAGVSSV